MRLGRAACTEETASKQRATKSLKSFKLLTPIGFVTLMVRFVIEALTFERIVTKGWAASAAPAGQPLAVVIKVRSRRTVCDAKDHAWRS